MLTVHKDTSASELEAIGTSDTGKLINQGRKFLDAGVERLMIESEGITENVKSWKTDVVSQIMKELPEERVMFEGVFLFTPNELPSPPPPGRLLRRMSQRLIC